MIEGKNSQVLKCISFSNFFFDKVNVSKLHFKFNTLISIFPKG